MLLTVVRRSLPAALAGLALSLGVTGALPAQAVVPAGFETRASAHSSTSGATRASAHSSTSGTRPLQRRQLTRALRQVVRSGGVGAVAEVVAGPRTWRGAAGEAFLRPRLRARPGAHFRAASVSKMLTSVLALQLVARGRWTLDTTIGQVRPGLWPGREDVTLRQLLSHTSGLPDYLLPFVAGVTTTAEVRAVLARRRTDLELVRAARTQPLTGEPGAAYHYSNTNFIVVGLMLKRATGQSLPRLMQRRVLGPARMTDSVLATRRGLPSPQLHEYTFDPTTGHYLDLGNSSPTLFSAAGALVSTTRDLNRFQRALATGRLLPRRLVRQLRSVQAVDRSAGVQYGLGSYRLPDPCSSPERPRYVYGHDGASFATLTFSLGTPSGRRRVAASTTGRFATLETNVALIELVFRGLSQGCPATSGQRAQDRWPVGRLAQELLVRQRLSGLGSET